MNLLIRPMGAIGILLLSLLLAPARAVAELNDGSSASNGQIAPAHRETDTERNHLFRAAFQAAPLSLIKAIPIAERLHAGSRTAAITFDTSDHPCYRVRTVKDIEIWENIIDVYTGRIAGPEITRSINDLEVGERGNINALGLVKQELSDAVAIAETVATGKAISAGLVKEGDQLNFLVIVLSDDRVKEVFLEPPRVASRHSPATPRKN